MKTKYFFQCCRELVAFRWRGVWRRGGEICLVPTVDLLAGLPMRFWHPLCAVAHDVVGFQPADEEKENSYDEWRAAASIRLPQEAAEILFVAPMTEGGLAPNVEEVRQELVHSLFPRERAPVPYNSLPWHDVLRAR